MPNRKADRYSTPRGPETEHQPGSRGRVLRNKLGIAVKSAMDRAEYEALVRVQQEYVETRIDTDTGFTSALLQRMHRDWLGGIYSWAGNYRTVNVSKKGFAWPPAYLVPSLMEEFERHVLAARTPCRPGSLREVAASLAEVHGELLLVHPFREGNGRLARWVAALMALQAGRLPPDFRFAGRGGRRRSELYLKAVQRAYLRERDDLTAVFEEALLVTGEGMDG